MNFRTCPTREVFAGYRAPVYWQEEDYKRNYSPDLPNFWITDTCFDPKETKDLTNGLPG